MKRMLRIFVAAGLLAAVASPAQGAGAQLEHGAFAMIELKPRRGQIPVVGVSIQEISTSTGTEASFSLFRGFCMEDTTDPFEGCMITDRGYVSGDLEPDEYEIDPLLQTAYMKVTRKGQTHELTWSAASSTGPDVYERYCQSGDPSIAAGSGYTATAEGTVFGRKGHSDLARIDAYAFLSACTDE